MEQSEKDFHHSFKPRWSPDGTLVIAASDGVYKRNNPLLQVKKSVTSEFRNVDMAQVFRPLVSQLYVVCVSSNSSMRCLTPLQQPTQTFLKQQSLTSVSLTDGIPSSKLSSRFFFSDFDSAIPEVSITTPTETFEKTMWQLCQILFDAQDPSLTAAETDHTRKQNLSHFWKSLVTSSALEHAARAKMPEEEALAHLSAFDVWGATETLLHAGDYRLGCMIAQVGGDKEMRDGMCKQIETWRERGDLAEMPAAIRALYEILAGNVFVAEGLGSRGPGGPENRTETFGIAERFGLDWKRAFGLTLWYGTELEGFIAQAVEEYESALKSGKEKVKPVPWFIEDGAPRGWKDPKANERQDVLWGLLKIYASNHRRHHPRSGDEQAPIAIEIDLAHILAPENASGHPFDALLSFQLYHTLSASGVADFPPTTSRQDEDDEERPPSLKSDILTTSLLPSFTKHAATLPSAIFVASHLTCPLARRTAMQNLLNLQAAHLGASPSTCPLFADLTSSLHVPATWIYKAKALHASAVLRDPEAQCLLLLQAAERAEAASVLRHVVGPACVVEGETGVARLRMMLATFAEAGVEKIVGDEEWERGGGLFDAYARLLEVRRLVGGHAGGKGTPGMVSEGRRLVERIRKGLGAGPRRRGGREALEERVAGFEIAEAAAEFERKVVERREGVEGGKGPADGKVEEAEALFEAYYARMVGA